ncbi:MAG: SurA N-terminal domain-containing protein [Alphaproteobacteria bacterium]
MSKAISKKIVFFCFSFFLLFGVTPTHAQEMVSARIIAKVNKDIITSKDLSDRVNLILKTSSLDIASDPALEKRLLIQVLQNLIDEKLQTQEARKNKVRVREEEIVQAKRELFKGRSLEEIKAFLDENNLSDASLTQQIEANILWGKYVGRTYRKRSKTTEKDILEKVKLFLQGKKPTQENAEALTKKIATETRREEIKLLSNELMYDMRSRALLDVRM